MVGSPTALADRDLEDRLKAQVEKSGNGFYVPSGAFWGGEDIKKMADRGTLKVYAGVVLIVGVTRFGNM